MKTIVRAKRRWFTPRRQHRIAWRTRWGRLEAGISDVMLGSNPMTDLVTVMRKEFARLAYEKLVRPVVLESLRGLVTPDHKPRGIFGMDTGRGDATVLTVGGVFPNDQGDRRFTVFGLDEVPQQEPTDYGEASRVLRAFTHVSTKHGSISGPGWPQNIPKKDKP